MAMSTLLQAYPTDQDHALWPMLHGEESVADEEELYDLELIEPEEAATTITGEIRNLIAFYDRVAAQRLGVVSYTT